MFVCAALLYSVCVCACVRVPEILMNIYYSWRCVLTSQHTVTGQNLLLLCERSPDTLSSSDGAQSLYGSSLLNLAVFHSVMHIQQGFTALDTL